MANDDITKLKQLISHLEAEVIKHVVNDTVKICIGIVLKNE